MNWLNSKYEVIGTYLSHYAQSQAFWIHDDYCKNGLNHQRNKVVKSKHQGIALHAQIDCDLKPNVRLAGQLLHTE